GKGLQAEGSQSGECQAVARSQSVAASQAVPAGSQSVVTSEAVLGGSQAVVASQSLVGRSYFEQLQASTTGATSNTGNATKAFFIHNRREKLPFRKSQLKSSHV
ncbi:unnamed protein product, partial [Ilex paraguariensis]